LGTQHRSELRLTRSAFEESAAQKAHADAEFEIMLSGRDVSAAEAAAIGLVSRVVPDVDLLDEALDLADQINGWSTQGTALTKRTMWAGLEMGSLRAAIEMENQTQLFVRLTTQNFEEAVRARKEGRPPEFED
jgi:enoyl-CoA hydratase